MNQPIVGKRYGYIGNDNLLDWFDETVSDTNYGYVKQGDILTCEYTSDQSRKYFRSATLSTEFVDTMLQFYGYEWYELFEPIEEVFTGTLTAGIMPIHMITSTDCTFTGTVSPNIPPELSTSHVSAILEDTLLETDLQVIRKNLLLCIDTLKNGGM